MFEIQIPVFWRSKNTRSEWPSLLISPVFTWALTLDPNYNLGNKLPMSRKVPHSPQLFQSNFALNQRSQSQLLAIESRISWYILQLLCDVLHPVAAADERGDKDNPSLTQHPSHLSIFIGGLVTNWEGVPHWRRWIPETFVRSQRKADAIFFFVQWLTRHFSWSLPSKKSFKEWNNSFSLNIFLR